MTVLINFKCPASRSALAINAHQKQLCVSKDVAMAIWRERVMYEIFRSQETEHTSQSNVEKLCYGITVMNLRKKK